MSVIRYIFTFVLPGESVRNVRHGEVRIKINRQHGHMDGAVFTLNTSSGEIDGIRIQLMDNY